MGPTSRELLPQKLQVVTRRPRNPPWGLFVLPPGGLPLPPPPLPVRRSLGIGCLFLCAGLTSPLSRALARRRRAERRRVTSITTADPTCWPQNDLRVTRSPGSA